MIYLGSRLIEQTTFPDGTSSIRVPTAVTLEEVLDGYVKKLGTYDFGNITWKYDNDAECMILWNLVHHIREHNVYKKTDINLMLPYIPNARMDRVKNHDEIFTLKWFAEFINSLDFKNVYVTDPHSNVSIALINNCRVTNVDTNVKEVCRLLGEDDLLYCFPDEGATKKYSECLNGEYVFGIKHRDWRTGSIESLELTHPEAVNGRNVLIVDDICSKGGTFIHTAKALKAAGAEKIYLYVTHCENTIFQGQLLESGLIEHIFTTDSIYRGKHDKITVLWRAV